MEPLTPSAFERVENPTAWRRWREAIANGRPIRPCGCPADDPHESHCSWYLRWIPD